MGKSSEEVYNVFKEWDSDDLSIAPKWNIKATRNDAEAKEPVFRKSSNSRVPVYQKKC